MEQQPEILAQHYAEAGIVEKSVAYCGKAGHRSTARSAIAEALNSKRGWISCRSCRTTANVSDRSSNSAVTWRWHCWS
jgi:hypothetical protein